VLLSAALPGLPYAQVADEERNTLESIRWSELRAYAQWAITPGRMHLVLVGDLRANETWPLLETSFGKLDGVSEITGRSENPPADVLERSGARRLQASQDVRPVLYMSWRIPPKLHPDAKTLDLLACLLGVGEASRLQQRIVAGPAIASRIDVRTGVPGAREVNLLLIEAEPASGRNLAELELALSSEILRLQREPIQDTEIRRAQSLMETAELRTLSDADSLARAMGEALCRGGDWRLAFPLLLPGKPVTQESLQAVARKYLIPNHATIALVEPDPLLAPQDALEKDLARLLTALVQKKLEDPARREALVREALRQLRMVSRDERLQVARLLDAQVKP
jgi:zinc protease